MFCMALTMQAGLGMAPWQSGNSFIALGVAYFISALYAPKLIARYSMGRILLTGLSVQIVGLLLLSATFIALVSTPPPWRWSRPRRLSATGRR
jgi:fucose permease